MFVRLSTELGIVVEESDVECDEAISLRRYSLWKTCHLGPVESLRDSLRVFVKWGSLLQTGSKVAPEVAPRSTRRLTRRVGAPACSL